MGAKRPLQFPGSTGWMGFMGWLLIAMPGLFGATAGLDRVIAPRQPSRDPLPLRQGEFLSPQSLSALAISPDGREIAVTTMAFHHDRNFWLLSGDGRILGDGRSSLGHRHRWPLCPRENASR